MVAVAAVICLAAATVGLAHPAGATPLDDLRAKVADAQKAADAATARYTDAENQLGALEAEMAALQGQIKANREQMAGLKVIARHRAVAAYLNRGSDAQTSIFLDGDPLAAARRKTLLEQRERQGRRRDRAPRRADHAARRAVPPARRSAHRAAEHRRQAAGRPEGRRDAAAAGPAGRDRLREAARAARRRAGRRGARPARRAEAGGCGEARAPVGGYVTPGIVCPVRGAVSFVDSWGAPRGDTGPHQGVDMMAARGTPDVAVVSGNVVQKDGAISGKGVRLYGDDGNLYYYFHLDAYEGPPRHVQQGEVVGYVGNTGDASGGPTHTHFEVHPGGGAAVDPYPSVASVC